MPEITVQIKWDVPDDPNWLNADNVALALHAYCKNTKFEVSEPAVLSASEAIVSFASWLTTLPEPAIVTSYDAAVLVGLVAEFCEANHLAEPREGWADSLVHPGED